jgi:hypothetical protein
MARSILVHADPEPRSFSARRCATRCAAFESRGDLVTIGGIRRGWPAIREGYAKLFSGSAIVRVAFYDFVTQGNNDFHLFVDGKRLL